MTSRSIAKIAQNTFLRGQVEKARGCDKPVHVFLGVPYAAPPVGDRRFQPPQKQALWSGTRDASEFGPICPQDLAIAAQQYYPYPVPERVSEDCLYMNVYTPSVEASSRLAVMVWIHGGGFTQGYSNFYNGTALATHHDVVFISINYRLGAFGFLCTGEDSLVRGNMGLLDQIAALEWIRDHVTAFGGDPNNVTVFGESAGGISVSHLIVSDLSRGLFHRGISQSGVAPHPGSVWPQRNAGKYLRSQVKKMGCKSTDSREILEFLKKQPADVLVNGLGIGFSAVLDHYFFKDFPDKLYNSGNFRPLDHMIGFNSHEGAQFVFALAGTRDIRDKDTARAFVQRVVTKMFYRGVPNLERVVQAITERYVEQRPESELTQSLVEMYGHLLFVASSVDTANKHSGKGRTYMYLFDHRSSLSRHPEWVTADHGDEIMIVLGEPHMARFPDIWREEDKLLSHDLMAYWANFAKTGNPSGKNQMIWPAYEATKKQFAVLSGNMRVEANFDPEAVQFWCYTIPAIISGHSRL